MAIVVRYFSTTAAGAGDGTTWADRAALFSAGNWSSIITGFGFNGADSLVALIEGGLTYSCGQTLSGALFTNAPSTLNNWLFLHGCNSSGVLLEPPTPSWIAGQLDFSTTTFPTIETTTNIRHMDLGTGCVVHSRMINFAGTAANLAMVNIGGDPVVAVDCCKILNSHSGSTAIAIAGGYITNSILECSGTAFASVASAPRFLGNCRIKGNASASSGNRLGVSQPVDTLSRCAIMDCLTGVSSTVAGNAFSNLTVVNCTTGILAGTTTRALQVVNSVVVRCGTGISIPSGGRLALANSRLRDNTTANITNGGNNPVNWGVDTSVGTDAAEFVDYAARDLRNKSAGVTWGKNLGPGDEAASGGGGGGLIMGGLGQTGIGVF